MYTFAYCDSTVWNSMWHLSNHISCVCVCARMCVCVICHGLPFRGIQSLLTPHSYHIAFPMAPRSHLKPGFTVFILFSIHYYPSRLPTPFDTNAIHSFNKCKTLCQGQGKWRSHEHRLIFIKHNQELISVSEEKDKGNKRSNRVDGHDG